MNNLLVLKSRKINQHQRQLIFQKLLPLVLGIASLGFVNPVGAQERIARTLTVSGRGVETIPTTITRVELGVEVQGKNANEVQQELARRSSVVVEALRSRNVENLQTSGISINPVYASTNNLQNILQDILQDIPRELTGYRGVNIVSFRIAPDRAGQIMDAAVQAGATRINGVSFTATEAAIDLAQQQALRLAAQDAQRQADTVLGALNLTRRDIVNIQINGATPPPVLLQAQFTRAMGGDATTPVLASDQKVEAAVTLTISY